MPCPAWPSRALPSRACPATPNSRCNAFCGAIAAIRYPKSIPIEFRRSKGGSWLSFGVPSVAPGRTIGSAILCETIGRQELSQMPENFLFLCREIFFGVLSVARNRRASQGGLDFDRCDQVMEKAHANDTRPAGPAPTALTALEAAERSVREILSDATPGAPEKGNPELPVCPMLCSFRHGLGQRDLGGPGEDSPRQSIQEERARGSPAGLLSVGLPREVATRARFR